MAPLCRAANIVSICPIHTADATQLSSWVASAVCTKFTTSSRRLPTDSVDNLETEHVENLSCGVASVLITFSTLCRHTCHYTNLNSLSVIGSTAHKIVNWVTTTTDGCVHTANTTQLDFAVGKFVQTRRDCRQLVANSVHTACRLSSSVASAVYVGHKWPEVLNWTSHCKNFAMKVVEIW